MVVRLLLRRSPYETLPPLNEGTATRIELIQDVLNDQVYSRTQFRFRWANAVKETCEGGFIIPDVCCADKVAVSRARVVHAEFARSVGRRAESSPSPRFAPMTAMRTKRHFAAAAQMAALGLAHQ
jgi:hypothetical protein|tara:strand:- start:276 stop:650 length:375 start_codon:yes stop_codon:yes gene_type:complete